MVGGGPAGAACATALARDGASVAVLTRTDRPDRPFVGETVPPSIIGPLARLGLWDVFRADGHVAAPGTLVCWGDEQPYEYDYIVSPYGSGWHVDRRRFDAMLLGAAADAGASGRAARCAQRRGGRRQRVDQLLGLICFGAAAQTEPRTILEASPDGWWYAAVLPQGRAVVAYFTDADLLPVDGAARERYLAKELSATRFVAGIVAPDEATRTHIAEARTSILAPCTGSNWLAVGDAARTLDPLSGQGLLVALTSAMRAADALLGPDRAVGLREFERKTVEQHRGHLAGRLLHYRRERRWPSSSFWERRHRAACPGRPPLAENADRERRPRTTGPDTEERQMDDSVDPEADPQIVGFAEGGGVDPDPDHAPLVGMLEDTVFRMPQLRPAVPRTRIAYIRAWIAAGCPDDEPPGKPAVEHEREPQV